MTAFSSSGQGQDLRRRFADDRFEDAQPLEERVVRQGHPVAGVEHEDGVVQVLQHGLLRDRHDCQRPCRVTLQVEVRPRRPRTRSGRVLVRERAEADDVGQRADERQRSEDQHRQELPAVVRVVPEKAAIITSTPPISIR